MGEDPEEPPGMGELVDVIPVKTARPQVGGGRSVVTAVELWTNRSSWHVTAPSLPERAASGPYAYPTLSDDAGTAFGPAFGGMRGVAGMTQMTYNFQPAPPPSASELRLTWSTFADGDPVVVKLPGRHTLGAS